MRTAGINLEHTKKTNRLLILRLLCSGNGFSRAELARRTGLAKMTVSNITNELVKAGLIEPLAAEHQGAGRPPVRLGLTRQSPAEVGLFLRRDSCTGICATMDMEILSQVEFSLGPGETANTLLDKTESAIRYLVQHCENREVFGVGIAAMGPLDYARGELMTPPNFYNIRHVAMAETLRERLGIPVFLANDMDVSASVEKLYGKCVDLRNFVYVGLTNGVGAGLLLNNSLFLGNHGFAGELGHMTIDSAGPLCTCGNRGCLETYVSVPRIMQQFRRELGREFEDFGELCGFCEQDPAGAALLDTLLEKLSTALINLCNLTDPEAIVIGHSGALFTDSQLESIEKRVNQGILAKGLSKVQVMRSAFGTQASLYGAAALPLQQVFVGNLCYEKFFEITPPCPSKRKRRGQAPEPDPDSPEQELEPDLQVLEEPDEPDEQEEQQEEQEAI